MKIRSEVILGWVKGPSVLDVGCTGHSVQVNSPHWLFGRIRENFEDAVGIDIHEENIRRLRESGFTGLHVADAENFDLNRRFDTIVSGELIEHLSNPGQFLRCARSHLAEGGRLVITTPYAFALFPFLYAALKFPKTCQNPQHTCWFCPQTFMELASRSGFTVKYWELIDDYQPDNPSLKYRLFVRALQVFGWIVPARFRKNSMLFVLEASASEPSST